VRDAIATVDLDHIVVFESGQNGKFTVPLQGSNVMYSDHHYAPLTFVANPAGGCVYPGMCEGRLWDRASMVTYIQAGEFVDLGFSVANDVPLFVGEVGAITTATGYALYDGDQADILDSMNIGWTFYVMRQASGFATFPCATAGDMTCGDAGKIGVFGTRMAGSVRPAATAPAGNAVVAENRLPGTYGWNIWDPPGLISNDTAQQIKGYASATSFAQGGILTLHVTTNPPQTFTIDVYRIGWYGGVGGRLMLSVTGLAGVTQPTCPIAPTTGAIECAWSPSYTQVIPTTWTSGAYLAMLTNAAGFRNDVPFVVRDTRSADILYQQSVTTYQAYNNYPNDGSTGKSLYDFNSVGPPTVSGFPRAVKVSFDRPYSDEGYGQFFDNELTFVQWLEWKGYDVTYSTDIDTHANGARLLNSKAFLSVGHDEYWTKEMFDAAERARDLGVNLGFFGANDVYWQVRLEPSSLSSSSQGAANRVMVGYKSATTDPVQGPTTTVKFRDPPVNRPEQRLIGIQFSSAASALRPDVPYVVRSSGHWTYRGTGFADGASIPNVVGYEIDRLWPGTVVPAYRQYQLLSQSPFTDIANIPDTANSVMYQAPSGAWVFGAGTINWGRGLLFNASDPISRITGNVLDTFARPKTISSGVIQVQAGAHLRAYASLVSPTVSPRLAAPSRGGTLLVASLAGDGPAIFTAPAGWLLASTASNGINRAEIWYYPNNPGGIQTASFTAPGANAASGVLSEWSGLAPAPLDGSGRVVAPLVSSVTAANDAVASGALAITVYATKLTGGGFLATTPGAGWTALGRDGTADWFHFASDAAVAGPSGWVGETVTATPLVMPTRTVDWSGAIATFKLP